VPRYRKKPVVICAFCFEDTNYYPQWFKDAMNTGKVEVIVEAHKNGAIDAWVEIKTLEGVMIANFGDYIIKGVEGEIYPCKPDIFGVTYEPAD